MSRLLIALVLGLAVVASGCTFATSTENASPAAPAAESPLLVVHKSPTCGCCSLWVDHMKQFVEGHVPAEDVQRLLMERPDALGLTVPGMPMGSPGMKVPSGEIRPYTVFLVHRDGTASPFAEHGSP